MWTSLPITGTHSSRLVTVNGRGCRLCKGMKREPSTACTVGKFTTTRGPHCRPGTLDPPFPQYGIFLVVVDPLLLLGDTLPGIFQLYNPGRDALVRKQRDVVHISQIKF